MRVPLGSEHVISSGALAGRRVGVVCNPASVDHELRHVADHVRDSGGTLMAIFGPQHGFRAEQGFAAMESLLRHGVVQGTVSRTEWPVWAEANPVMGGSPRFRALVHERKLRILDEPTAGVDIEIRRSMWQFLRDINAAGVTIILTTHYLEEAESLCRHVAIIDAGQIIKNDRMENVVRELQTETFVLSLRNPIVDLPEVPGYALRRRGDHEIEAEVANGQGLNELFAALSQASIEVVSMRTRSNRLEELFVRLVGNRRQGNGQ